MKKTFSLRSLALCALCLALLLCSSCAAKKQTGLEPSLFLEAASLAEEMAEIANKDYVSLLVQDPEIIAYADQIGSMLRGRPQAALLLTYDTDRLLRQAREEAGIPNRLSDAALDRYERQLPIQLMSMVRNAYGITSVATSSLLTVSAHMAEPKGWAGPCSLVLEYRGLCVCVNFAEAGENIIGATAMPVQAEDLDELLDQLEDGLGGLNYIDVEEYSRSEVREYIE